MADVLPTHNPDVTPKIEDEGVDKTLIATVLDSYRTEAEEARRSGPSPRDTIWAQNWDRYWGRYDHSKKAAWQAKFVMPETPQFVDRWAAAMREALTQGGRWFTAADESGQSNELIPHIEKFVDLLLSRAGRTHDGHTTDFASVFEDQMKLGSLMACCLSVTFNDTHEGGWPAVSSVDPREYFGDPQQRNLYRLRRYTVDKHRLLEMAQESDDAGESLYDTEEIMRLQADIDEDLRSNQERSSGHGQGGEAGGGRTPVTIDEWLCTILLPDGSVAAQNALVIVANGRYVIRGPEENPFWHKRDWMVFTPMVTVPFSLYGRTYAEDWSDPADAFVELTNLIMDAIYTTSMNAYAAQPDMLKDPSQLEEGFYPNVVFDLEEGMSPREFMKEIELGSLPPEAITVWRALKQEMREGAKLSEIALGQVPPKGDITATEVNQVQQSGSAMIRSMARTVEARLLEPTLTLVFQTALQHMDFTDERLAAELGVETAAMLHARKEDFSERRIKFRVRALSGLVDRQVTLQGILGMLQTFAQSDTLMENFLAKHDVGKLTDKLMELFGVNGLDFKITERERMLNQVMTSLQQSEEGGGAPAPAPASAPASAPAGPEAPASPPVSPLAAALAPGPAGGADGQQ